MKDIIKYYYNFSNVEIKLICEKSKNKYYVKVSNNIYILKELCNEINNYLLSQSGVKNDLFRIVLNKNSELVTKINGVNYILLDTNGMTNRKINLFDIKNNYYVWNNNSSVIQWIRLWETKIDNFEKWLLDKKMQYDQFVAIFWYFIGISENSLQYLKSISMDDGNYSNVYSLSHRRVGINTTLYDYYDPSTVIVDHPIRDISEYIKSEIINKCFDINLFGNYLEKMALSQNELELLYARILFPTFFYDSIESNIEELFKLINTIDYYEGCLFEIGKLLNKKYNVKKIEWLEKSQA